MLSSRPRSPLRSRRSLAAGYTAVEVLMALTVMTIGAAAVISMQRASVQGNFDARKMDIAAQIAETWKDRLRKDSMVWTLPGPACSSCNSNLSNALVVSQVNSNGGQWFLPTQRMNQTTPESWSPGFDILGRDMPMASLNQSTFCVNLRLTWLWPFPPPPGPNVPTDPLIRADVRVMWLRTLGDVPKTLGTPANICDTTLSTQPNPDQYLYQPGTGHIHAVYSTTTITRNTAQ